MREECGRTKFRDKENKEIEPTPEMVRAGAEVIWSAFNDVMAWGSSSGEDLAKEVFLAMASKSLLHRTNKLNP